MPNAWEEDLYRDLEKRIEAALVAHGRYQLNPPVTTPAPGEPTRWAWEKVRRHHESIGDQVSEDGGILTIMRL
jgi:hypothetical protein